jgi:hypothetical protein
MTSRTVRKAQLVDWIKATTASVIGAGDGIEAYWRGEPMPVRPREYAIIYLPAPTTVGNDETIREYDPTEPRGSEMRHYQAGQRQLVLDISIWSARTSDDHDAAELARRIVDRIHLDDWKAYFAAAGLAFARIKASTYVGEVRDERQWTLHHLDIEFNAVALEEGTAIGYVATIDDAELEAPLGVIRWTGDIPV